MAFVPDTAEHALFVCPGARQAWDRISEQVGVINAGNIVQIMLESKFKWKAVEQVLVQVISEKEREERLQEREEEQR